MNSWWCRAVNAGKEEDRVRELWTSRQTKEKAEQKEKKGNIILRYRSQENMQIGVVSILLCVQCAQKREKQVFMPNTRLIFEPSSPRLFAILSSSH